MTQTRDPTTGQLFNNGAANVDLINPSTGVSYSNAIPIAGPYSKGPLSVRIESGISTTRKRLTFNAGELIHSLTILAYHNATTLATTDAHDEQDYLMFVVNAATTATADSLLNGGDTTISSPDDPYPVMFARPGEFVDFAITDEGIYITHVDVISGDSAGAGPDLGVWIGGRS